MDEITVKKCSRREYAEMLDMLHLVFEESNSWFQTHLTNCTPYPEHALDEEIAQHYIAMLDGRVIGSVGAYPSTLVISPNRSSFRRVSIRSFGIGQVACVPEHRNKGVMTHLISAAMQDMKEEHRYLGYLSGDRFRYGFYGFDYGAEFISFGYNANRFARFIADEPLTMRKASFADFRLLNGLYEQLPSYVERDERAWQKNFLRDPYSWYIGEGQDGAGYICAYNNSIIELQGGMETVKKLIYEYMTDHSLEVIRVSYPFCNRQNDRLYNELWRTSSAMLHNWLLVSITKPSAILDIIAEAFPEYSGLAERVSSLGEDQQHSFAQYLFGSRTQPLPEYFCESEYAEPFVCWVPKADHI